MDKKNSQSQQQHIYIYLC